jgi:predicted HAD superfamily Cof-like phosphohydrolase
MKQHNVAGAWDEVLRSNMAKVDPLSGKVRRREDGKILKPEGWKPPNLTKFVKNLENN